MFTVDICVAGESNMHFVASVCLCVHACVQACKNTVVGHFGRIINTVKSET